MVADNDAGEDDVVDGVGDVTDRDHDIGADEAGQGGGDKEDCQTIVQIVQICNDQVRLVTDQIEPKITEAQNIFLTLWIFFFER